MKEYEIMDADWNITGILKAETAAEALAKAQANIRKTFPEKPETWIKAKYRSAIPHNQNDQNQIE